MSLHIFANVVTPYGTASNNRGEVEGNASTLQKLIWKGEAHTTVSAEAIRFSLRRLFNESGEKVNRSWNEDLRQNVWENRVKDGKRKGEIEFDTTKYVDDDLLGYMTTHEASSEGGEAIEGSATVRRSPLEVTRAVSLTQWPGDMAFNAASPGAQAKAAKGKDEESKGKYPVLYVVEMHSTRYQFGLALTPERLMDKSRAAKAIRAFGALNTVAGNHGRFLFDFSPESIVLRITDDPAPRLLYCFESTDNGKSVSFNSTFTGRVGVEGADIDASELIIGGSIAAEPFAKEYQDKGAAIFPHGVKKAIDEACKRINASLKIKE